MDGNMQTYAVSRQFMENHVQATLVARHAQYNLTGLGTDGGKMLFDSMGIWCFGEWAKMEWQGVPRHALRAAGWPFVCHPELVCSDCVSTDPFCTSCPVDSLGLSVAELCIIYNGKFVAWAAQLQRRCMPRARSTSALNLCKDDA
jgi:hypothetical protein